MFDFVLDKREHILQYKMSFLDSRKICIFPKELTHAFNQNIYIFFSLIVFGKKKRLEITFNNVLDRKETVSGHTKFNLLKSQKLHFSIVPKGLTHAFGQKYIFFSLLVFGQNKTRNNV